MKKPTIQKAAEYVLGMLCTYLGQKRETEACALEDQASQKRREGMTFTLMGHQFLQRAGFEVRTFDPLDDKPRRARRRPIALTASRIRATATFISSIPTSSSETVST